MPRHNSVRNRLCA